MLSRRNIRFKVMKVLYSMNRDKAITKRMAKNNYKRNIDFSYDLYLLNVLQLVKIAEYSQKDAAIRSAKLLPSEEDKRFVPKLYDNPCIMSIVENQGFQRAVKERQLSDSLDEDMTRNFYQTFAKMDAYKAYLMQEDSTKKDHANILLELYRYCSKDEDYNEFFEDIHNQWIDDSSLVVGAMKKTLKSFPLREFFYSDYVPDDLTTEDYGEELLVTTIEEDEELLAYIKPTLKNWEAERVAIIDMILIKMALCEFLYFETIPPKVTINEYVEVSKLYSTPKSKDFVNGVLDKLSKQLRKDGKIVKTGRGLID